MKSLSKLTSFMKQAVNRMVFVEFCDLSLDNILHVVRQVKRSELFDSLDSNCQGKIFEFSLGGDRNQFH